MRPISRADLEALRARLTRALGVPPRPYAPDSSGRIVPCPGALYICAENGGFSLRQMAPTGTGETDLLGTGQVSRRELSLAIRAFLAGLAYGRP